MTFAPWCDAVLVALRSEIRTVRYDWLAIARADYSGGNGSVEIHGAGVLVRLTADGARARIAVETAAPLPVPAAVRRRARPRVGDARRARPRGGDRGRGDRVTSEQHVLRRDGDRDLRFSGALLGAASSYRRAPVESTRWTEVDIYRTDGGSYVVAITGASEWEGERDRHSAVVCADPTQVVAALYHDTDGRRYLTATAREALAARGAIGASFGR